MSTFNFSTLYTTFPHNLIKDKLIDLIERTFQKERSPYLACNDRNAFLLRKNLKKYHAWSCQNVCDALTFLLDNIFIRFGTKLYRQVVSIPMGTNCAPVVADSFLFCYERDFMVSLSDDKQADVIDAFNTTSRYLDDILNIKNVYFDNMVKVSKGTKIRNRYKDIANTRQNNNIKDPQKKIRLGTVSKIFYLRA